MLSPPVAPHNEKQPSNGGPSGDRVKIGNQSRLFLSIEPEPSPKWAWPLSDENFELAMLDFGIESDAQQRALVAIACARFPLLAANNPMALNRLIVMELEAKYVLFRGSTFNCLHCGQHYSWKVPHMVVSHLVRKHGVDTEEARRLVAEARESSMFDQEQCQRKAVARG